MSHLLKRESKELVVNDMDWRFLIRLAKTTVGLPRRAPRTSRRSQRTRRMRLLWPIRNNVPFFD